IFTRSGSGVRISHRPPKASPSGRLSFQLWLTIPSNVVFWIQQRRSEMTAEHTLINNPFTAKSLYLQYIVDRGGWVSSTEVKDEFDVRDEFFPKPLNELHDEGFLEANYNCRPYLWQATTEGARVASASNANKGKARIRLASNKAKKHLMSVI